MAVMIFSSSTTYTGKARPSISQLLIPMPAIRRMAYQTFCGRCKTHNARKMRSAAAVKNTQIKPTQYNSQSNENNCTTSGCAVKGEKASTGTSTAAPNDTTYHRQNTLRPVNRDTIPSKPNTKPHRPIIWIKPPPNHSAVAMKNAGLKAVSLIHPSTKYDLP